MLGALGPALPASALALLGPPAPGLLLPEPLPASLAAASAPSLALAVPELPGAPALAASLAEPPEGPPLLALLPGLPLLPGLAAPALLPADAALAAPGPPEPAAGAPAGDPLAVDPLEADPLEAGPLAASALALLVLPWPAALEVPAGPELLAAVPPPGVALLAPLDALLAPALAGAVPALVFAFAKPPPTGPPKPVPACRPKAASAFAWPKARPTVSAAATEAPGARAARVAPPRCRVEVGACGSLASVEPRPPPSAALCMPVDLPGVAFAVEDGVEGAPQEPPQAAAAAAGATAVLPGAGPGAGVGAGVDAALGPAAAAEIAGWAADVESAACVRCGNSWTAVPPNCRTVAGFSRIGSIVIHAVCTIRRGKFGTPGGSVAAARKNAAEPTAANPYTQRDAVFMNFMTRSPCGAGAAPPNPTRADL